MQLNLTPVVKNLLIINLLIFVGSYLLWNNARYDINDRFGLYSVLSENIRPEQMLTFMFLHAYRTPSGDLSFSHIFGNMFALFMFGPLLEQVWGGKRFLLFYLITGMGAGLLYLGVNFYENYQLKQAVETYVAQPDAGKFATFVRNSLGRLDGQTYELARKLEEEPDNPRYQQQSIQLVGEIYQAFVNVPLVGASGAIFGLLMAFGLLFPNTELFLLFIPFPIKAKYFVGLYGIYELYNGIQRAPGDSVAHFAHLGGMLFGFLLIKYWNTQRNDFY